MRRLANFLMLVAMATVVLMVLLVALAGMTHPTAQSTRAGATAFDQIPWLVPGLIGFGLGLGWRFIVWELPGKSLRWLEDNRKHSGALLLLILLAGVLVLA
jgi:hypothetical protein